MSHSLKSLHTVRTCVYSKQTQRAQLDQRHGKQPEHGLQGQSEFPDHDADLFFKPFVVSDVTDMKRIYSQNM